MNIYHIEAKGSMEQLSHLEMELLTEQAEGELYTLFRNCALAVLNSGAITDDSRALLSRYRDFKINLIRHERGMALELHNPPESAFVDDKMILNIQYHLFAVLRDILFLNALTPCVQIGERNLTTAQTNQIFLILRNAKMLPLNNDPNMAVCWGGHSISEIEYQYCRAVGLELGLREMNIMTGCGTGVMEAPMKGAAVGHANQRYRNSRFIGVTEPSIIASEPPNPIVNELVIMPDIEKRLEAFVRLGHAIIIFPGGPGTFEELLYILGVKLNPENSQQKLPLILTGPEESRAYFDAIDRFIGETLGKQAQAMYEIIINDPVQVAQKVSRSMKEIKEYRRVIGDSYAFNWTLKIAEELQQPFFPTHENMAALNLTLEQPQSELVANLRQAFSGIVAGNIKSETVEQIEQKGRFKLSGDPALMAKIDRLLWDFIEQDRMKLPSDEPYQPCYEIV
ncbi:nucleotide 5'-monophosphate nucleosidase PpnN [Bibersteinia trehalosi]|uniref:nucleotide 5'-monophosphate nucleosidase PpnN n=1 Tax=Bibersteinia trehalosi TaxID=47735 RepID=UPI002D787FAC|nr:nucleotide 5'-monophosphate nucleosidase PpnN [Bibersteinia trehalosi]